MLPVKIKIEWQKKTRQWRDMPNFGRKVAIIAILISILIHVLSFLPLNIFSNKQAERDRISKRGPIKITLRDSKKKDSDESNAKRIIETPQQETQKPKDSSYLGAQDHATEKETKVKPNLNSKAADAGQLGSKKSSPKTAQENQKKSESDKKQNTTDLKISRNGQIDFGNSHKQPPRNRYESLLPSNDNDLPGQITAGYQDLLDDKVIVGERIDMNTTSYRYIGYFTGFRKQIELVWIYPTDAVRRGIQGEVQLEIIIEKDGHVSRIKIIRSSGHSILDEAMVATIKQAAPFAPIPAAMHKARLVIVGTFRYILTAYAGG